MYVFILAHGLNKDNLNLNLNMSGCPTPPSGALSRKTIWTGNGVLYCYLGILY